MSPKGFILFVKSQIILIIMVLMSIGGCTGDLPNDPYPQFEESENILYSAFTERPKHLDPAISYSSDEAVFTYQIYEPPLQYHYLKRPFELIPLTAQALPEVRYTDVQGAPVEEHSDRLAYTIYRIQIAAGIYYQDHPAFAKYPHSGKYRYHELSEEAVANKYTINDFHYQATRELVAEDYLYEIKRLADPEVNSPIYGVMENYIQEFRECRELIEKERKIKVGWLDLREISMAGARLIDRYTFEIIINGRYPPFMQWLAMPFFAPIPWEVDRFYSQPALQKKNITLDWFPVGTGPFILSKNDPNMMMVLEENQNFHGERYPDTGALGDEERGYLKNKNKSLPLLDKVIFILEKEDVPYWNKFLQGYYDQSGVTTNNFDQALKSMSEESVDISDELRAKGITLDKTVLPTVFYWGVNMLDDTIGGYSEKNKKLRHALAIAFDLEEFINIFLNGRAEVGHTPLPEGIFGYREDAKQLNTRVYNWDATQRVARRKSIEEAKQLLAQAGYPNGIDPRTKKPLTLSLEVPISSGPDAAAQLGWFRKQFEKLGIQLIVNATQYSRYQDKLLNGDAQLFVFGWSADYPDPENFLFLFDSENGKVKFRGENATNYENKKFDQMFQQMKVMHNSDARQVLIDKMNDLLKEDLPWIAFYYPTSFALKQQWVSPSKPNPIARNTLKYLSVDPPIRRQCQQQWNQPIYWPLMLMVLALIGMSMPAVWFYYKKMHRPLGLKKSETPEC